MADYDDVEQIAEALPEVEVGAKWNRRTWIVGGKGFCWERPFSKADIKRFGSEPGPSGPILAIATEDLDEKEAILAAHPDEVFTIEHFNGYSAVLVQLDVTPLDLLEELILDAWLVFAPEATAQAFLAEREG